LLSQAELQEIEWRKHLWLFICKRLYKIVQFFYLILLLLQTNVMLDYGFGLKLHCKHLTNYQTWTHHIREPIKSRFDVDFEPISISQSCINTITQNSQKYKIFTWILVHLVSWTWWRLSKPPCYVLDTMFKHYLLVSKRAI